MNASAKQTTELFDKPNDMKRRAASFIVLILLLVQAATASYAQSNRKLVAFLISDGTLVPDYTGAYEVFAQARMKVYTVAKTMDPVKLSSNMQVIPNYSIENSPDPDILVIPAGGPEDDAAMINWIKAKAPKAEYVLTVCGGVYPVYAAGLLDGLTVTTYGPLIDHFRDSAPNTKVVTDRRFVDNGKVITAGSYVAGIDGALHIISKMYGEARAQEIANNIEYNWDKSYKFVRSKLADSWLAPLYDFGPPLNGKTLRYEGNERRWVAEYEVTRKQSLKEFSSQIPEMAQMHHWKHVRTKDTVTSHFSEWTRKDFDNRDWICIITIRKVEGEGNRFRLTYEIGLKRGGRIQSGKRAAKP